ncbi:MAG: hypothetical protein HYR63_24705 [Proteobacteria bacterium]|nr:hypothetical protein [Pseudomonadota bacterium]
MTITAALLNDALALHRSDRQEEAAPLYRRALAIEPSKADALHLLGLVNGSGGRRQQAVALVRRAIAVTDRIALYHCSLGRLLLHDDVPHAAEASLDRALRLDPSIVDGDRLLAKARHRITKRTGEPERCWRHWGTSDAATVHPVDAERRRSGWPGYLVIRAWGYGFWGEVNHVAVQLALAEIMGREPFVYWGSECRYGVPGIGNAWELYFEPVSTATAADLTGRGLSYFPARWHAQNLWSSAMRPMLQPLQTNPHGLSGLASLNRPEAVAVSDHYNEMVEVLAWAATAHPLADLTLEAVYRHVFDRYIRLQPALRERIDRLSQRLFGRRPVLAVHYRAQHRFKVMESLERRSLTFEDYSLAIDRFLAVNAGGSVFLLCDDAQATAAFAARYGERMIILDRIRLSRADEVDIGLDRSLDGRRLAEEVLEDAYLAAACDAFVGDGASGVSCGIVNLKAWTPGSVTLLRRNVFLDRRWSL